MESAILVLLAIAPLAFFDATYPSSDNVVDVTKPPYSAKADGVSTSMAGASSSAMSRRLATNGRWPTFPHRISPPLIASMARTSPARSARTSIWAFFSEVCYNGDPFQVRVSETRGTETKNLGKDDGHTAPYSGRPPKP
jgi:hypothetical protein